MRTNLAILCPGSRTRLLAGLAALMLFLPVSSWAMVRGEEDLGSAPVFNLTARDGTIATPDGASIYSWGFAGASGVMQYPAPTLIVEQGAHVTVNLTNFLPAAAGNVSIVFPGHEVTTTGGAAGLLTAEATPGGTVKYEFDADRPGTFVYHSGTRPDLQVEMGLTGALIVRPSPTSPDWVACPAGQQPAYYHLGSCYTREYMFLLSEIDIDLHRAVEAQIAGAGPLDVVAQPYRPEYWLLNGRGAPDTMAKPGTEVLPHQPYNALVHMHPGEKVLMRVIGGGRQMHPFHHHGNHAQMIARDAHLLTNGPVLVGGKVFTITGIPGGTADAVWEWTGERLGFDIYGHTPGDGSACIDTTPADGYDDTTHEWCDDHLRPIPVDLPALQNLTFGGFWSGSPFLGVLGYLPPGEGGLNPSAGFSFMWHSHNERELVNNDVFPGGMMTMCIVDPPGAAIEE